jgi:hypothetical protein
MLEKARIDFKVNIQARILDLDKSSIPERFKLIF